MFLHVEALALRKALHFHHFEIRGDSKCDLIQNLKNQGIIPWKMTSIIQDIHFLIQQIPIVHLCCNFKETNMVVDQLASIGHSLLHLCIWFSNFPFSVVYRYETVV